MRWSMAADEKSDLLNGGVRGCTSEKGTSLFFIFLGSSLLEASSTPRNHLYGLILQVLQVNLQTGNEKARMTALIKRPPAGNVGLDSCLSCSCINQD